MVIGLIPKIYFTLLEVIKNEHLICAIKKKCFFAMVKELCYVHYKMWKKIILIFQ